MTGELKSENGDVEVHPYDISKFKLGKILSNNIGRKSIALLGTFPDLSETDEALIVLEKVAFTEKDVQTCSGDDDQLERKSFFYSSLDVRMEFVNNIYGNFQCSSPDFLNEVKTTVVYPATIKHIEKYSARSKYLIRETPALYENVTLPYLKSSQFSLDWVYNILEHKQETDRIVFEDPDPEKGFVLVPDLKWDGRTVETLYLLAITHKRNIRSIRDLNASHLPLLRNVRDAGCKIISEKFGLEASQLRVYFHYQPSFYHLHVHFNPIHNEAPGIYCEKSHLIDTIINNIELVEDYYQKATLPFIAYEGNKLLDLIDEEFDVRKKVKAE